MTNWLDLITDVEGISVGHADDSEYETGVTALCGSSPMVAAVHCCGGAPATRETDLLGAEGLVDSIDALMLCGGSAFGLAACDGAMSALVEQNKGFKTSAGRVPIVPAASIFDFYDKKTFPHADYQRLGKIAIESSAKVFPLGNFGAGRGARAGPLKGGIGSASTRVKHFVVGALAVVNAFGSAAFDNLSALRAWEFEKDGEFGNLRPNKHPLREEIDSPSNNPLLALKGTKREHTTLCVIAFSCILPKSSLMRIARVAQSALAIALYPSLTLFDGDIVFALSSAKEKLSLSAEELALCERIACETLARAIAKGVWCADSTKDIQCFRDARAAFA